MDRRTEWFVPSFGPERFRVAVGLLFLPYTGMVLSFAVIGSMLAPALHWDRVAAIVVIYFLALGIGAHVLDAVGSRGAKPWGEAFTRAQLWTLAIASLVAAYAIGIWYMVLYTPLLWLIAIPEGFFLLAYNLESDKPAWRFPQVGSGHSAGGTMTTAGGLVFFGDDAQSFEAVDAQTGKPLWHFNTGQGMHASPMSYAVNGKQYVAIAAGSDIFSFGLP